MTNVFIYQDPHPAHQLLADVLKCKGVSNRREGLTKLPSIGRLMQASSLQEELEKLAPKIIITENLSTDLLAGAIYKNKHPKTKLIGIIADPKIYELKHAPLYDAIMTHWSLDKADLLMLGSDMMIDLVPHVFRDKTAKFFPPVFNLKKHLAVKAKFNKNLVFVGRLDEYKGVDLLYNFFVRQKHEWPNSVLYVAGKGKFESMFLNSVCPVLRYLGRTSDSLFMGDVAAFYLALARCEPSGVAIVEAMAQGVVPIVSKGVGYKELVCQVDPRLVVEDIKGAERIINHLFGNKREWEKLSKRCKVVAAGITEKNCVDMFKAALSKVYK